MTRRVYAALIIQALRENHAGASARAAAWLEANLTEAAIHGCHHCGEADRHGAPCWWCGLRDVPAETSE
jgi:hypothetical protein